ncbi:NEW3 domain-containing protein [Streptomyces sp. WAC 06738]|uniref:NEW3 domain-containing protein n=1 Tax=Streptomyces sp. WAC 06738 TaxID=2203210 RepID=UPI001F0BFC40|nr:NEW3 domain-containing protein [Streptomyces sp. WAC 06738]
MLLPATVLAGAARAADAAQTEVTVSPIDLEGPAVTTVTVTVRNTAPQRLRDLRVSFSGPVGWVVEPEVRTVRNGIAPNAHATVTFELLVPAPSSGFRLLNFTATALYEGGDGLARATATRTERRGEPLPTLAAAYNSVGVTDESNTAPGDFDGGGNSFSAQKLADVGLSPGAAVTALGAELTWPDVPPGVKDNVSSRHEQQRRLRLPQLVVPERHRPRRDPGGRRQRPQPSGRVRQRGYHVQHLRPFRSTPGRQDGGTRGAAEARRHPRLRHGHRPLKRHEQRPCGC